MAESPKPDTLAADRAAMSPYLDTVTAVLGGERAMRDGGKMFLPKFPYELDEDYAFRLKTAKFTNIFQDIVENLASKPFADELEVQDADGAIEPLVENIDGQGNHLHVFAASLFYEGIANGLEWVLVDYTRLADGPARTRAEEQAAGARPYWVRIPHREVIAAYSDTVDGEERLVHFRIRESEIVRDGFEEQARHRVRVFDRSIIGVDAAGKPIYGPATVSLWERQKVKNEHDEKWVLIEEPRPISIGVIPIVPFLTGRRIGSSWSYVPPMRGAAELQVQHYQAESRLSYAETMTAFPMLAGNGVQPELDEKGNAKPIPVGPRAVLYAPPYGDELNQAGEWSWIEPGAESLKFLASQIETIEKQLRELGRQPLTAQTGNLTVVTTAVAADKGNSAVQAWALALKDTLENCLKLTSSWLGSNLEPTVAIKTDFDLGILGDDGFEHVLTMNERGVISDETTRQEARRRSILGPESTEEDEMDRLLEDVPGDDERPPPDALDAAILPPQQTTEAA